MLSTTQKIRTITVKDENDKPMLSTSFFRGKIRFPIIEAGIKYRDGIWMIHKIHVSSIVNILYEGKTGYNTIEYALGGAGGGGGRWGGGGGAGGRKTGSFTALFGIYPVVIGLGGKGAISINAAAESGGNSTFNGVTSIGGGGGASGNNGPGRNGASGGGAISIFAAGTGVIGEGHNGGAGSSDHAGGGGGNTTTGVNGIAGQAGDGGDGLICNITGNSVNGGGGGGGNGGVAGIGKNGGASGTNNGTRPSNATQNSSSGGGGGGFALGVSALGSDGSDGYLYLRYLASGFPDEPGSFQHPILKLLIPSLIDQSGNGFNSSLGANLPIGFTAPTIDGNNNLIFSGNKTVKLHTNFAITSNTAITFFIPFYTNTPDAIESLIQFGLDDLCGARIVAFTRNSNRWVIAGGVYKNEAESGEPAAGKSLPKLHKGYNVFGISFSPTIVSVYLNGVISLFSTNPGAGAPCISGWLGAFPGTTNNIYTLSTEIKLLSGTTVDVYNTSAKVNQLQAAGNKLMKDYGFSSIFYLGDSTVQGFTVSANAQNWTNIVSAYLIDNTPHKFASANLGIGSRFLVQIARDIEAFGINVPYNWTDNVYVNPLESSKYSLAKKICVMHAGINDIANNISLTDMQAALVNIATTLNASGLQLYALSVTSDAGLTTNQEAQRLSYNSWLNSQAALLGFVFVNTCSNSNLSGKPSGPNAYFSDGVHYTPAACDIIAPMVYNSILANF